MESMSDLSFQAPALQVLWQAITADPMDFQSWTALLSQVESVGSVGDAHLAYDGFLRQFPLCFGYWKKYANLARRHPVPSDSNYAATGTSIEASVSSSDSRSRDDGAGSKPESAAARVTAIFERAVVAAPFCREIWEAFVGHAMEGAGEKAGGGMQVGDARRMFERALEAVGDHPGTGELWRKCVAFEETQGGQERRVAGLYERALGHRLADLEVLWVDFRRFADRTPWEKLAPEVDTVGARESATATATTADNGENRPLAAVVAISASEGLTDAEKMERFVKMLQDKREVSLRERERRESFERRLTRPHFHVKPLDDSQLSAWSEYMDFEQAQATQEGEGSGQAARPKPAARKRPRGGRGGGASGARGRRRRRGGGRGNKGKGSVERLFERCLVPCASYWWLWERYALWKESIWGVESALEVAERACSPFVQWRPEALFFRAELLERVGRTAEARAVYRRVLSEVAPGLVEGACKLACFERRCGDRKAAEAAYRLLLPRPLGMDEGEDGGGAGKLSNWEETTETTRPYLYMQLARFQHRISGDPGAARTTFRAAVADIPGSRELWLAFLEFEAAQPQALHAGRVEAAFRMAVGEGDGGEDGNAGRGDNSEEARRLTVEDRADLWEWFEEFVEDLSMDVSKVMSVRVEHRAWTQAHGASAHEAAAATAAGGADLPPQDGTKISTNPGRNAAEDKGNSSAGKAATSSGGTSSGGVKRNGDRGVSVARGAGGGVGSGAWDRGSALTGGALVGRVADADAVSAFAQQSRDQWAAYYQQQVLQQQALAGGVQQQGVPGLHAPPPPPAVFSAFPGQHGPEGAGATDLQGQHQQQLAFQLQQQQQQQQGQGQGQQAYGAGYAQTPAFGHNSWQGR